MNNQSKLGKAYQDVYELLAGAHPGQRPWHFQWSAVTDLHRELARIAPRIGGVVLDVGCGSKPYRSWFGRATGYVGIDIADGPEVDVVVGPEANWPFEDAQYDAVVSIEVLEHVENLEHTLGEIRRTLKPGGLLVVAMPFLYNEHGAPGDYRRFTKFSARRLLPDFKLESVTTLGGVGTTVSIMVLNWIEAATNGNKISRIAKGPLLPVWLAFSFVVNMAGKLFDRLDRTDSFYGNVLMVFVKPAGDE